MKLSPLALGLACGSLWGILLPVITAWALVRGHGRALNSLGRYYLGYSVSTQGILVGAVWAFASAFVIGALLAWAYNRFVKG